MKKLLFPALTALIACFYSCGDEEGDKYLPFEDPLCTGIMEFRGSGIIYYTITGEEWGDANTDTGPELFSMGQGRIEKKSGLLLPDKFFMAAYVSGTVPEISFRPEYRGEGPSPDIDYDLTATLALSLNEEEELFSVSGTLSADEHGVYPPVAVNAPALPEYTASLGKLRIRHRYSADGREWDRTTEQEFALTWKEPVEETPLYYKLIRWGSKWLNARVPDTGPDAENSIADVYIEAMKELEGEGYSYGSFARPAPEEYTNTAEVFLKFKRSACGEFRGFFLGLLESQGIDAMWLLFSYYEPSSEDYSMYQTRTIAALGREAKVWRYANHIMIELHGIVYDPVYLVRKNSMEEYEDFMFASYCYGEDYECSGSNSWCTIPDGPQKICVDNPPGYNPGISPPVYRGHSY